MIPPRFKKVLEEQKLRFGNKTYHELLNLMPRQGDKPHVYTIKERDETYQLEVATYWLNENKKGQDLLVYFSIYNTYRTAQNPLRDTIVKKRYE
ncbi:MAG: hypothetical protein Q9M36_00995 [Sulfurovum sp.]|nr:hypothetical protein [Sulfurovum sp.]